VLAAGDKTCEKDRYGRRKELLEAARSLASRSAAVESQRRIGRIAVVVGGIALVITIVVGVWMGWAAGILWGIIAGYAGFIILAVLWAARCRNRADEVTSDALQMIATVRRNRQEEEANAFPLAGPEG
jgi:Flp pilus assembly protein TadB